jgi:hypothetical protein
LEQECRSSDCEFNEPFQNVKIGLQKILLIDCFDQLWGKDPVDFAVNETMVANRKLTVARIGRSSSNRGDESANALFCGC